MADSLVDLGDHLFWVGDKVQSMGARVGFGKFEVSEDGFGTEGGRGHELCN